MTTTKYRLLSCLKKNPGQWVSGESVSDQLGITRAAVWKHIKSLKEDGHHILSAPKKGYWLKREADLLSAESISEGLNTSFMGRPSVTVFKETDSTNLQAKILASRGAAEGTLVAAETQTRGRGRRGRSWFSPPGRSICVSFILRPPMAPAQAPQITLMTAVAVARTLQGIGLEARIKWPNDILVKERKIAGILTEISTEMDLVDWMVVGLGLNVNVLSESMPSEIRAIATSVRIEKGHPVSRVALLCTLLKNFEACYAQLMAEGFGPIMHQWRQMTDIIGRRINVDVMDTRYTGTVAAVDDDGVLILEDDQGGIHRIFSGDVTQLRAS